MEGDDAHIPESKDQHSGSPNTFNNSVVEFVMHRSLGEMLWPSTCKLYHSLIQQMLLEHLLGARCWSGQGEAAVGQTDPNSYPHEVLL